MFASVLDLFSFDMAIDLGTANTLVYVPGRGIVLDEPSVVANSERGGKRQIVAVGANAKNMLGRTPGSIHAIRPLRDGVIADFQAAEEMIKSFIQRVQKRRFLSRPRILVCVPSESTPVERRAIQEAAHAVGARQVFMIEEPIAAAIGAGMSVSEPRGAMIVDIGGGTTEVAVISLGGIVYASTLRVAGDHFDEALIHYLRRRRHIVIGESSAEQIKIEHGSVVKSVNGRPANEKFTIRGRDLKTGVPKEIGIAVRELADAFAIPMDKIAEEVVRALEEIPPELATDIGESGITLTGGGALLRGIDKVLADRTNLTVRVAENPLSCVALGTGRTLENLEAMKNFLVSVY